MLKQLEKPQYFIHSFEFPLMNQTSFMWASNSHRLSIGFYWHVSFSVVSVWPVTCPVKSSSASIQLTQSSFTAPSSTLFQTPSSELWTLNNSLNLAAFFGLIFQLSARRAQTLWIGSRFNYRLRTQESAEFLLPFGHLATAAATAATTAATIASWRQCGN